MKNYNQQGLPPDGFYCVNLADFAFGRVQPLTEIACTCPHPPEQHQTLTGVLDATGDFCECGREEYPDQVALKLATIVLPMIEGSSIDFSVDDLSQSLPNKGTWDTQIANVDGAGFHSRPDGSHPASLKNDVFSRTFVNTG